MVINGNYPLVMTFTGLAMENQQHAIKYGKPSISIRGIYTMANC